MASVSKARGDIGGQDAFVSVTNSNGSEGAAKAVVLIGTDGEEGAMVRSPGDLITVTPTLPTNAMTTGDVLFDLTEINNAVRVNGGCALLQSVQVTDKADQKAELRLIFFTTNSGSNSLGAAESAPDISDAEGLTILGDVLIETGDYVDLGGVAYANKKNIGLMIEAAAASRDIFVGAVVTGTPTYAADSLQFRFGVIGIN